MKFFSYALLMCWCNSVFAQKIAVAADRENVLYIGVENPLTVTAENCNCSQLVVKTSNGTINGSNCRYVYKGNKIGKTDIIVYRKTGNTIKKMATSEFRVKNYGDAVFMIGPYYYGNADSVIKSLLAAQEYVRAELWGTDFDVRFTVLSFNVNIYSFDTCVIKRYSNSSGKISDEIRNAFSLLKKNDIIIFNELYAMGPDGTKRKLTPLTLIVGNFN